MSRRPVAFRQADLKRALAAAKAAGADVATVEIAPDGKIVMTLRVATAKLNDNVVVEQWMAGRARSS
jgi:CelD/BcsL family acetyltransferase involved in cellulose biosynthesis